jgi:BirA family transcriptional regulator, biotin operon repressor / biotin---[acetyl-CoA-carboxylase] ligase
MVTGVPGDHARSALAGSRFSDVRWMAETGSTQADALGLAREGAAEGIVLVADHQTAGRGRQGRSWTAPPGSSLLVSLLLRPPAAVAGMATMVAAVAAAGAVEQVAGFAPRSKWPNDLVWPGDDSMPDRKLAGVLAEADWPAASSISGGWREPSPSDRVVVIVGIGCNVNWPTDLPDDLADLVVACNHVAGRTVDREQLLVALLERFDEIYGDLVRTGDRTPLLDAWRARSATLGRRVRVEQATEDHVGTAVDVTQDGHLVVDTLDGGRKVFAAGDVVHLRPA